MAALIKCFACKMGDCDNHVEGRTQEGVMGGWLCPCTHTAKEREEARKWHEGTVQSLLGRMQHDT